MTYTFDGNNRIITLGTGTTLDVRDIYSRWKNWAQTNDNSKYELAFTVIGGDPIDIVAGIYITSYFFLVNDWRIRPEEASYSLTVSDGVLLTSEGDDPFIATLGTYQVLVRYSQPVKSETIATGGSGITVGNIWQDHNLEAGLSPEKTLRLILSAVQGLLTITGNTVTTKDIAGTKDRLVVETNEQGERLSIIRDAT